MKKINNELLTQFSSRGLTINEGIAMVARLVQSANHPLSDENLEEEQKKRECHVGLLQR